MELLRLFRQLQEIMYNLTFVMMSEEASNFWDAQNQRYYLSDMESRMQPIVQDLEDTLSCALSIQKVISERIQSVGKGTEASCKPLPPPRYP